MDQSNVTHCWDIPSFAGKNEVIRGLQHGGLEMVADKAGQTAIFELLYEWELAPPIKLSPAHLNVPGLTRVHYSLGGGRFIRLDDGKFVSGPIFEPANEPAGYVPTKLRGWKEAVSAPCVGNPLLILGVSAALAGPMRELLDIEGGGLHLRGQSSCGKSTILQVAASVWGAPKLVSDWLASANDFDWFVAATGSAFLALDEFDALSPQEADRSVVVLSESAGTLRPASASSTRYDARWQTLILSAGEASLEEKMSEAGMKSKVDLQMHVIDIVADNNKYGAFNDLHGAPSGSAFSQQLTSASALEFGSAGQEFEFQLTRPHEDMRTIVEDWIGEFEDDMAKKYTLSNDSQVSSAVKLFGLIAAAGELASDWKLTGWPMDTARNAAVEALGDWLKNRNDAVRADEEKAA